jgi:hypothetical protein
MGQRDKARASNEGKGSIKDFLAAGGFQNASMPLHM